MDPHRSEQCNEKTKEIEIKVKRKELEADGDGDGEMVEENEKERKEPSCGGRKYRASGRRWGM